VAKFVIEKDRMYTENGNLANGNGVLNFSQFEPFSKNPPSSKIFLDFADFYVIILLLVCAYAFCVTQMTILAPFKSTGPKSKRRCKP